MCVSRVFKLLIAAVCFVPALSNIIAFPGGPAKSACATHNGLKGECLRVDGCPEVLKLLRQGKSPKICGYERAFPIVCCPIKSEPVVEGVSPPKGNIQCGVTSGSSSHFGGPSFLARARRQATPFRDFPGELAEAPPPFPIDDIHPIAGGINAKEHEWPWMALLGHKDPSGGLPTWFCSAVLLNTKWVLTAAHCFSRGAPDIIRLGEHDFSTLRESGPFPIHSDHGVGRVFAHPGYRVEGGPHSVYHDLALIELDSEVTLDNAKYPICLPWGSSKVQPGDGEELTITGWGATEYGGEFSPILQVAEVEVFPVNRCNSSYAVLEEAFGAKWPRGITEEHYICAGKIGGKVDTCQGDSGGPVIQKQDGKWVMVGVVSQGYGCGLEEFPALYVNMYQKKYLQWIKETAFGSL